MLAVCIHVRSGGAHGESPSARAPLRAPAKASPARPHCALAAGPLTPSLDFELDYSLCTTCLSY